MDTFKALAYNRDINPIMVYIPHKQIKHNSNPVSR